MKRGQRNALRLTLTLLLVGATMVFAFSSNVQKKEHQQQASSPDATEASEGIFAHRRWTRVNPQRFKMNFSAAMLCRLPTALDYAWENRGPHRDKFITVYVNDAGKQAMMSERTPKFPVGSMIVKEKFSTADAGAPELLTAMLKREAGYNPASGDWEYLVLDGAGKKIEARGKLDDCMSCHTAVDKQDFVFRSYLPVVARQPLRPLPPQSGER